VFGVVALAAACSGGGNDAARPASEADATDTSAPPASGEGAQPH